MVTPPRLTLVVHRLPPAMQRALHVLNHAVIALFGGLIAWQGWGLVKLNRELTSPALEISLGWLYTSTVVGGTLIALYALAAAAGPVGAGHRPEDVLQ